MTTKKSTTNASCPLHILNYIEDILGSQALNNVEVKEIKSAQQQVFVFTLTDYTTKNMSCTVVNKIKTGSSKNSSLWQESLESGCSRLVIRIWKGSSRWWNLHQNEPVHQNGQHGNISPTNGDCYSESNNGVSQLARAEVAGYRISKEALDNAKVPSKNKLQIPQVLYFSLDDDSHSNQHYNNQSTNNSRNCQTSLIEDNVVNYNPWAIFSYVGPDSLFFAPNPTPHRRRLPTNEWVDGMTKVRHEFGFDEPHPRWGRVPEDQCLDYTLHLLKEVILPMHLYFFSICDITKPVSFNWKSLGVRDVKNGVSNSSDNVRSWQYGDMLLLYERAHDTMQKALARQEEKGLIDQGKLERMVKLLDKSIHKLTHEAKHTGLVSAIGLQEHHHHQQHKQQDASTSKCTIPPVLCHMDCQPQNLICFHYLKDGADKEKSPSTQKQLPHISSILDWEEAAFADPRFELLLLCRKVCANKEQAQRIWNFYEEQVRTTIPNFPFLGPIEPWLKLETVHSITTLLLQSMDLLGGGRNPWESKPDLYGKLEREFQRLNGLGWKI